MIVLKQFVIKNEQYLLLQLRYVKGSRLGFEVCDSKGKSAASLSINCPSLPLAEDEFCIRIDAYKELKIYLDKCKDVFENTAKTACRDDIAVMVWRLKEDRPKPIREI